MHDIWQDYRELHFQVIAKRSIRDFTDDTNYIYKNQKYNVIVVAGKHFIYPYYRLIYLLNEENQILYEDDYLINNEEDFEKRFKIVSPITALSQSSIHGYIDTNINTNINTILYQGIKT